MAAFFLGTATVLVAAQSGIRCGDVKQPGTSFEVNPKNDLRFVPMDAKAFHFAFRQARKSSYGRYEFFFVRRDREAETGRQITLMIGESIGDRQFFRIVDDKGQWPVYEEDEEYDEAHLLDTPTIASLVNDAGTRLFRMTFEFTSKGGNHKSSENTESAYIVAAGPPPRIEASIDCNHGEGGGVCGLDSYTEGQELVCDWSRPLHDFACTSRRANASFLSMAHPEERRFSLIGGKSLPVTKPGMASFSSLEELGRRLRTDPGLSGERVMVDGIGLLAPLEIDSTRDPIYAAPGLYDDMELRVFAFPRDGEILTVSLDKVVDGHEAGKEERAPEVNTYTPTGELWSITLGEAFDLQGATVHAIVLHDGKGRGLFWLAIDETGKPLVMSVLRLAADVGSYDHCNTFIYPASASAVTVGGDHADLTIEPHSRRSEGGEAMKSEEDDGEELPCHVRGTVTWDREKGFTLLTTDVPCQPNEVRAGVVIDAFGHLSAVPLRYEEQQ